MSGECNMKLLKYSEPEGLTDVHEFHELTSNNIEKYPTIPSGARVELRINLITEELQEFKDAVYRGDLVEAADALCDLQYVLSGSILELGLASCFKELFDEVHTSNMSKACKTLKEVEETKQWYVHQGIKEHMNQMGYIKTPNGDFFVIDLTNNNKTLKSKYYSPANLKPIIEKASISRLDGLQGGQS